MSFKTILTETRGKVGVVTLNRPQALNALNRQTMHEVVEALAAFDADAGIAVMVLTGSEKAFAAGADIKEMQATTAVEALVGDFVGPWDRLSALRKPLIGAVAGHCLGGGCEVAMLCDLLIAADTARFGQPEITIGTIPGMGGTQRLTRVIGKSKAMEMILTGRVMKADEAERCGLVARVVPAAELIGEAMKTADRIAAMPAAMVLMAKAAINRAYETTLAEGVRYERQLFYSTFATADQKEGMQAFIDKRPANFSGK